MRLAAMTIAFLCFMPAPPAWAGADQAMTCAAERPAAISAPDYLNRSFDKPTINATPYIFIDGALHDDFSLSADLQLPEIPANAGNFYADWLLLIPNGTDLQPFIQISFMRWRGDGYRPEVDYTWLTPHGEFVNRLSSVTLDDRPKHTFFIRGANHQLSMGVDGRVLCTAPFETFFGEGTKPLFFQLGGELVRYGDRISGTAANIRLKTDADPAPHVIASRCRFEDRGIRWTSIDRGTYELSGMEQNAPRTFVGFNDDRPCVETIDVTP